MYVCGDRNMFIAKGVAEYKIMEEIGSKKIFYFPKDPESFP